MIDAASWDGLGFGFGVVRLMFSGNMPFGREWVNSSLATCSPILSRLLNAPSSKGVKLRSLVTSKEPLVTKLQSLTP
jgi:hypothetical protein